MTQTFKPHFTLRFSSDLRRFRVWMHREQICTDLVSSTKPHRNSTYQISSRTAFGNFEGLGHLSGVPEERPEKIGPAGHGPCRTFLPFATEQDRIGKLAVPEMPGLNRNA